MADIIVESKTPAYDGMSLTFRAACDCSEIEGLAVNFPNVHEDTLVYEKKRFEFKDALGNILTGLGNLFAKGAYVHVILDTVKNFAYIQNAATNAYIEKKAPDGYITPSSVIDGSKYFDLAWTEDDLDNWLTNIVKSMDVGTMKMSAIVGDSIFQTTSLVQVTLYRDDGPTMNYAHCVATFSAVVNGCATRWQKSYDGSAWSKLEWENPPMREGVEYRTTERHNGKPVYMKTKSLGMGDVGETRSAPITSDATENFQVVSIDAVCKPPSNTYPWFTFPVFNQNDGSIAAACEITLEDSGDGNYQAMADIHTFVTMVHNVATITVKYTK